MSRKTSIIVRIVSWSIVAAALIVIMVLSILGKINVFSWSFSFGNSGSYYLNSGKYQVGEGEIPASDISDLDINWIDGKIIVEVYDGDTIQISEKSGQSLKQEDKLRFYNDNGKLKLQYRKSEKMFFSFGSAYLKKELTVKIPAETAEKLGLLNVDTVSSKTFITGVHADELRLDATSGDFTVKNSKVKTCTVNSTSGEFKGEDFETSSIFNADTTSGDISIQGSYGILEFDTVSGNLYAESAHCPSKIETDSTSGNVTMLIPENEGFVYRQDTVSGSFRCDFQTQQKEKRGNYKDGGASFSFDSVSGNVEILKK